MVEREGERFPRLPNSGSFIPNFENERNTMICSIKKLQGVVLVIILITGIAGCHRENVVNPTAPEIAAQENLTPVIPVMPQANFYVNRGDSDQIGAYVGKEFFLVQLPAGSYRLEYFTDFGIFNLVFRNTANVLLFIGLQSGDQVQKAVLYRGTIFDTSKEKQEYENLTLFCWPDSPVQWWEVFRSS